MKFLNNYPPPYLDPVVEAETRLLSNSWNNWFSRVPMTLDSICNRINVVSLTNQSASVGPVDFANGRLLRGLYRATYTARVSTAGASSSVTVQFSWTDGGTVVGWTGPAMAGNVTTAIQSNTIMFRSDEGTPIYYSVAWAGVGSAYNFDVILEKIIEKGFL